MGSASCSEAEAVPESAAGDSESIAQPVHATTSEFRDDSVNMRLPATGEADPEKLQLVAGDFVRFRSSSGVPFLFGTVVEHTQKQTTLNRLGDGQECVISYGDIERMPFNLSSRVEVVGEALGDLRGHCAEIVDYLPDRERWVIELDWGPKTAARSDHLRATDKPKPEPPQGCCGGAESDAKEKTACTDRDGVPQLPGLDANDQALVELVAKEGVGDWDKKALTLTKAAADEGPVTGGRSATELEQRWLEIAPQLREHLATDPTMPCGHKCGSCPSRSTCHLHDELEW